MIDIARIEPRRKGAAPISNRWLFGASLALGALLGGCSGSTGEDGSGQTTQALSPAQECTDDGGTYVADGPNSTCTFAGDPVGNSDNTKGGSQTSGPGKSEPNSTNTDCTGVNNKPHQCP